MNTTRFDLSHRFLFDNTDIRGEIVSLEQSYASVREKQNLPASLLPLLGEFIAAVALLGENLKFEGTLTLQVRGDGLVPLIMAETNEQGQVRGILKTKPEETVDEPLYAKASFKQLIGEGILTITIDPVTGERYQGIVPLQGDTLGDCLSHYFEQSEQLPTRLWLFADSNHCGGLLLQSLPPQKIKTETERQELWSTAVHLANTLRQEELFELTHEQVLFRLFNEMQCRVFSPRNISFQCSCNVQRSSNAIASLGKNEAYALLEEQNGIINIDCEFCGERYQYRQADLEKLFGSVSQRLH